jgi:hypothetical protein
MVNNVKNLSLLDLIPACGKKTVSLATTLTLVLLLNFSTDCLSALPFSQIYSNFFPVIEGASANASKLPPADPYGSAGTPSLIMRLTAEDNEHLTGLSQHRPMLAHHGSQGFMEQSVDRFSPPHNMIEVDKPRLQITHAHFNCNKKYCGNYHEHCILEIYYSLPAMQTSTGPIDPLVRCKARICYHTAAGDILFSEANSEEDSGARHHCNEDGKVTIDFRFSFYETVVKAQLDTIECRIVQPEENILSKGISRPAFISIASTR